MRHVIPISGKDSLATALVMRQLHPEMDFEYVFNPTGAELPCVFEWLDKVSAHLGKEIVYVGADLFEIIEEYNFYLPSRQSRYCTRKSKIEPFEEWIGKEECTVYYGIRADENRGGYENARYPNIIPNYPLKDNNLGINEVYQIINEAGLKPPTFFWQSVYDVIVSRFGEERLKSILTEWQMDILFCWRTRANCYFCFNQKKSEWVGLLEHEPELFWKSETLEHSESEYFWNGKNYPLTKIVQNKDIIKAKHIKKVFKLIIQIRDSKWVQNSLFDFNTEEGFNDFFKTTSCGLFCGK